MQTPVPPYPTATSVSLDLPRRLPGQASQQAQHLLPLPVDHPDPRHRLLGGLGDDLATRRRLRLAAGRRRSSVPAPGADAPLPQEVPALVVRLEPPAHAVPGARLGLRRATSGRIPLHRRGAGGPSRFPLSRRQAAQSRASAGQVVPGHPPLDRALLPVDRSRGLRHHRLVRHPLHRQVPAGVSSTTWSGCSAGRCGSRHTRSC